MTVIRYFASVKAAAGTTEEPVEATTLAEALAVVRERHDGRFVQVLAVCSFVVDGHPVGTRDHDDVTVGPDSVIECLPPFAGG